MKFIDIQNWKRRDHYNFFNQLSYPHFSICGNLDLTEFHSYVKQNGLPFFISILYAATKTANNIDEFRLRIRGDKIVEHENVSPSFTVMTEYDVFSFCTVKYLPEFIGFKINALEGIDRVKNNVHIEDEPGRDDLLYITSLPWVSFTSVTHPIQMNPVDSIPRISWGKYFAEGGKTKLPFSVQVHHALVDGVHVGRYFTMIQELLDNPAMLFRT